MAAFDGRVLGLLAAAGSGSRLGFDQPKAFVELAGRTLLERSLDVLSDAESVSHTLVIVSADMRETAEELVSTEANVRRWAGMSVEVVLGGRERMDSVYAGLGVLEQKYLARPMDGCSGIPAGEAASTPLVVVHDAARCLTPPAMIAAAVAEAARGVSAGEFSGVVPVLPVTDTIKLVDVRSAADVRVEQTPARGSLRAAQTPQVFALDQLLDANQKYLATVEIAASHASQITGNQPLQLATDDSSLMEIAGYRVQAVEGDPLAMKITTPMDYRIAELMLQGEL